MPLNILAALQTVGDYVQFNPSGSLGQTLSPTVADQGRLLSEVIDHYLNEKKPSLLNRVPLDLPICWDQSGELKPRPQMCGAQCKRLYIEVSPF
jgi:hypothetical protein